MPENNTANSQNSAEAAFFILRKVFESVMLTDLQNRGENPILTAANYKSHNILANEIVRKAFPDSAITQDSHEQPIALSQGIQETFPASAVTKESHEQPIVLSQGIQETFQNSTITEDSHEQHIALLQGIQEIALPDVFSDSYQEVKAILSSNNNWLFNKYPTAKPALESNLEKIIQPALLLNIEQRSRLTDAKKNSKLSLHVSHPLFTEFNQFCKRFESVLEICLKEELPLQEEKDKLEKKIKISTEKLTIEKGLSKIKELTTEIQQMELKKKKFAKESEPSLKKISKVREILEKVVRRYRDYQNQLCSPNQRIEVVQELLKPLVVLEGQGMSRLYLPDATARKLLNLDEKYQTKIKKNGYGLHVVQGMAGNFFKSDVEELNALDSGIESSVSSLYHVIAGITSMGATPMMLLKLKFPLVEVYDIVLISNEMQINEIQLKKGKLYVRISNGNLEYTVINAKGEKVIGEIKDLKAVLSLSVKEFALLVEDFGPERLKKHLPKILNITSKRGHTTLLEKDYLVQVTKGVKDGTYLDFLGICNLQVFGMKPESSKLKVKTVSLYLKDEQWHYCFVSNDKREFTGQINEFPEMIKIMENKSLEDIKIKIKESSEDFKHKIVASVTQKHGFNLWGDIKSARPPSTIPIKNFTAAVVMVLAGVSTDGKLDNWGIKIFRDQNNKIVSIEVTSFDNDLSLGDITIAKSHGYDFCLMSKLPDNKPEKAEFGKIYLSVGSYCVRDPQGNVHQAALPKELGITPENLVEKLKDGKFKTSLLRLASKAGHIHNHYLDFHDVMLCLDQMDQPVDQEFCQYFLSRKVEEIFFEWLRQIMRVDEYYSEKIKTGFFQKDELEKMHLPMRFKLHELLRVYQTLGKIHSALTSNPLMTHRELLEKVYPLVGKHYAWSFAEKHDPHERYVNTKKSFEEIESKLTIETHKEEYFGHELRIVSELPSDNILEEGVFYLFLEKDALTYAFIDAQSNEKITCVINCGGKKGELLKKTYEGVVNSIKQNLPLSVSLQSSLEFILKTKGFKEKFGEIKAKWCEGGLNRGKTKYLLFYSEPIAEWHLLYQDDENSLVVQNLKEIKALQAVYDSIHKKRPEAIDVETRQKLLIEICQAFKRKCVQYTKEELLQLKNSVVRDDESVDLRTRSLSAALVEFMSDLDGSQIPAETQREVLTHLSDFYILDKLTLRNFSQLEGQHLKRFANHFPHLKSLTLIGCDGVTVQDLKGFLSSANPLNLWISESQKIKLKDYASIYGFCQQYNHDLYLVFNPNTTSEIDFKIDTSDSGLIYKAYEGRLGLQGDANHFVAFLLEIGAAVNFGDLYGRTPLHFAAKYNHPDIVTKLLERGAKFEIKDTQYFETPFKKALALEYRSIHAALTLLLSNAVIPEERNAWNLLTIRELQKMQGDKTLQSLALEAFIEKAVFSDAFIETHHSLFPEITFMRFNPHINLSEKYYANLKTNFPALEILDISYHPWLSNETLKILLSLPIQQINLNTKQAIACGVLVKRNNNDNNNNNNQDTGYAIQKLEGISAKIKITALMWDNPPKGDFVSLLQHCSNMHLTHVFLHGTKLNEQQHKQFREYLTENTRVKHVSLQSCGLDEVELLKIISVLGTCAQLESINLQDNTINDSHLFQLINHVLRLPNLRLVGLGITGLTKRNNLTKFNKLTLDSVTNIEDARPNLEILFDSRDFYELALPPKFTSKLPEKSADPIFIKGSQSKNWYTQNLAFFSIENPEKKKEENPSQSNNNRNEPLTFNNILKSLGFK